jgi:FAD/FMN-containing dehydrogenase
MPRSDVAPIRIQVGSSWGRYPAAKHTRAVPVVWRDEPPVLGLIPEPVLAYGCGRSYGDSCLNDGGALLVATGLDRFIALEDSGLLRCEAGVTLAEILDVVVPRGWFLPVVPSTKWVTVGGAIANDIHGKNHHRARTFGVHVTRFELLRSSGQRLICAPDSNRELFAATIGGLGLTGLILWAEIRLQRVAGTGIAQERIRFGGLDEFLTLAAEDAAHEYTVAWVDCLARGRRLGRGVYLRGAHVPFRKPGRRPVSGPRVRIPFEAPRQLINRPALAAFNALQYRRGLARTARTTVAYEPFFFPLDAVGDWNRLYGTAGFLQYQCVVPEAPGGGAVRAILERVSASREMPALAVLKRFGPIASPGLLSFPRPGLTLAIDLAFRGRGTLDLLNELDREVLAAGGAVYPAKDARMSSESFRAFFPAWRTFAVLVDPRFSSSFWRRVHDS